jgi:predicted cupin superfamily sugar epimerase
VCTSIYYMLTREAPVGYWHMNQSTIVHYWQGGSPLTYLLIPPSGVLEKHVLGPDIGAGHTMQVRRGAEACRCTPLLVCTACASWLSQRLRSVHTVLGH